jgi:hypothetical protein
MSPTGHTARGPIRFTCGECGPRVDQDSYDEKCAEAERLRAALQTYVDYDVYINGVDGDPRTDRLQKAREALADDEVTHGS